MKKKKNCSGFCDKEELKRGGGVQKDSRAIGHANEKQHRFVTCCAAPADGDILSSD